MNLTPYFRDAEAATYFPLDDFVAHFRSADDGEFVFESVEDETKNAIDFIAYPILTEAFIQADEQGKKLMPVDIRAAVRKERKRVQAKRVAEPSIEIGKLIEKETLLLTTVIDRMVRSHGTTILRRFRSRRVN